MQRARLGVACTALFLGLAANSGAQDMTDHLMSGNDIINACAAEAAIPADAPPAKSGNLECRSYLRGFFESVRWLNQESKMRSPGQAPGLKPAGCFHLPDFVSFHDLGGVVAEYGSSHPDTRTKTAVDTVRGALAERYPCKDAPPG